MNLKGNLFGIITIVAVALGIIGFFFRWVDFDITGETGLNIILQNGGPYTIFAVALLVVYVGSVVFALALMKGRGTGGIKFLFLLLSAIALASALWMFFDLERDAGMGLFMEIAATVLLFLSSVFIAIKKS